MLLGWASIAAVRANVERSIPSHPELTALLVLLNLIAVLLIISIIVSTIQADPPCGNSPDWKIRPIPGLLLAIEKVIFLAVVISLPLLASSIYVLIANGFAIMPLLLFGALQN